MIQKTAVKKWKHKELDGYIRYNNPDNNAMIIISALYKRIYGKLPKIGLSGQQIDCIEVLCNVLPKGE